MQHSHALPIAYPISSEFFNAHDGCLLMLLAAEGAIADLRAELSTPVDCVAVYVVPGCMPTSC
jgi:hypothetical protein